MLRIHAAWRASTECTESAAARVFLFAIEGAAPAYAATPVSSSAMAVFWNVAWLAVVPLKSNAGFLTACMPSAVLRNATCWASSIETTFAYLAVSPLRAPLLTASA